MLLALAITIGLCTALVVALGVVWWRARMRIATLEAQVRADKAAIDRNAKLLMDKNVELFDQNATQERLAETREDFVAIVSHQLRTPVTELRWSLASLFDAKGAYTPPDQATAQRLFESVNRMMRLIDMLIRFVSAEQGKNLLALTEFSPDDLVRETIAAVSKNFLSKNIPVEFLPGYASTIASIDPNSLDMIVANLVENALFYTPAGGHVTVRSEKEPDGSLLVSVQDSGMGIPEKMRPLIFSRFNRAPDAVKANETGSGIGLYFVKRILESHGGTIGFESTEGKGSTFHFSIPAKPAGSR